MTKPPLQLEDGRYRTSPRQVACLFAACLTLYAIGLGWGLPNGNDTWAADAIKPAAPLSVANQVFLAQSANSGWFWFKYPLGHVLLLDALYAPYLGWLTISGGLSTPVAEYPFGLADPETALTVMALIGRLLSAAMAAATVVLAFLCLRGFGTATAWAGAALTALCYPFVYYAHTTNVEAPMTFWLMAAFYAAVRLVEGASGEDKRGPWLLLGACAAMAVSSKELAAGFCVGLPFAILAAHLSTARPLGALLRGGAWAALSAVVVMVFANAVFWNPSGFFNRLGFLSHALPPETALAYAPYYFPIELEGFRGIAIEARQVAIAASALARSLGPVVTGLAVVGIALAWQRSRSWALLAVCAIAGFYLVGVKALLSLSVRYVLPASVLASMLGGVTLAALWNAEKLRTATRTLAVGSLAFAAVYACDVTRMLVGDARYAAEAWIGENAAGSSIEVYQRPTYLPRFPGTVRVAEVPFEQRTIEALAARGSDMVVLSSAGEAAITTVYRTDWDQEPDPDSGLIPHHMSVSGKAMTYRREANERMLAALRDGSAGYREVARFHVKPWLLQPDIRSLNPEIVVYRRNDAAVKTTSKEAAMAATDFS